MNTVIKESINLDLEKQKVYGKLKEIADILRVDVATIYIYDEKLKELILWCSYGLEENSWGKRIPITRGLVGKCAREMRPISVKEPSKHPDFYYVEGSGEEKYQSFLAIPVTEEGKLLGIFVVQTIEMKFFLSEEIKIIWTSAERFVKEILKLQKRGGEQRWKKLC